MPWQDRARFALLLALIGGSYWPTLRELVSVWRMDLDNSAGQVVPLVALYAVWLKQRSMQDVPVRICWWGLAAIAGTQMARLAGVLMLSRSLEFYSLVLTVHAAVLLLFGPAVVRRLAWVLVLLLLAVPLPARVHAELLGPLQTFATASAVVGLTLLGHIVQREGNVLQLNEQASMAVVEACSGLRMLTAFVIVGATLCFMGHRPAWQNVVLMLATLPVAVLANTLRLVATALVFDQYGTEAGERFFHGFAGLTMMPFAIAVLLGLLWAMRRGETT